MLGLCLALQPLHAQRWAETLWVRVSWTLAPLRGDTRVSPGRPQLPAARGFLMEGFSGALREAPASQPGDVTPCWDGPAGFGFGIFL